MAFNLTAQLNIALNSASLRNASNQLNSALNTNTQIKLGIDRNSSSGLNQIKSQISEATDSMENFGRQAGFAAKRFAAFAVTAGSIIAFTNTMKEAVSAAVDFDREMVRLRQVSSDTVQDVGAVGDQVTNLSKNLGVSSKDLIGVAVVLKQANLTLSETKDALEAMAQAALAPNFDNLKDTTEGAIAIMKQFKVEAKDLGAALGSVNAVAGEFAVEASDIIEAIRKTGGAFKAAGGQLNELIALFTSVRQTTRESAESIGTGLRTIFTRIQRNDTANALKEVGINLRYTAEEARALGDAGLEQQFVGPYEAVKRLSAGLSELRSTDPRFSAIVEQLGGYRQISKVIPLIQEFATAQKALGIAQAGSVSLAVNAGQAQDALAVKLQKLKESFFEVGRSIVNSPGFRSLADTFIGAATSVLSLINSLKGLLPLFTALAAVKIGQGLGSFATGFVKGAGSDSSSARTTRKADGGFLKMRTGGIVPGSGSGDKVPALLEPGEMVIPKGMVRRQMYANKGNVKANDSTAPAKLLKKSTSEEKVIDIENFKNLQGGSVYYGTSKGIGNQRASKTYQKGESIKLFDGEYKAKQKTKIIDSIINNYPIDFDQINIQRNQSGLKPLKNYDGLLGDKNKKSFKYNEDKSNTNREFYDLLKPYSDVFGKLNANAPIPLKSKTSNVLFKSLGNGSKEEKKKKLIDDATKKINVLLGLSNINSLDNQYANTIGIISNFRAIGKSLNRESFPTRKKNGKKEAETTLPLKNIGTTKAGNKKQGSYAPQKLEGYLLEKYVSEITNKEFEGGTERFDFRDVGQSFFSALNLSGKNERYIDAKRSGKAGKSVFEKELGTEEIADQIIPLLAKGGPIPRQRFMEGKYVGPKPLHPDLSAQEILGMAKGYKPNEQEVKKGFGRASLIHHPDRGGSNYNMGRVNSSYNYLKGGSITDWEKSVKAARTSYVDELKGMGQDKEAADFESTIPVRGKNKAKSQQSTKTTGATPEAEPKQDPNLNNYADESFAQMNARTGNSSSKARREWQFATPDAFTTPNRFDSFEAVRNASQFREKEEKSKTINASSAYSDRLKAAKAKRGGYFEGGPIIRMKKGGIVPGSGSGDKVRALLEPGELVVPKHQVARQKFGEGGGPKRLTVGDKSVLLGVSLSVPGLLVPFAASLFGMESVIGADAGPLAGLTYAGLAAATSIGSGIGLGLLGNKAGKKIFSSAKQIEEKKQAKKLEAESKIKKQYEKRNIADRSSILLPSGGEEGSNIPKSFVTTKELSRSRSPDSGRTLTGLDSNETYDARKSIEAKEERRKKKFAEKYLGIKKEKGIFGGIRDKLSKLNPLNLLKPNLKKDPKTGKLISDTKEFQEFQYERQVKRGNREYQNRLGYALGERKDEPTAKPVVSAPTAKPGISEQEALDAWGKIDREGLENPKVQSALAAWDKIHKEEIASPEAQSALAAWTKIYNEKPQGPKFNERLSEARVALNKAKSESEGPNWLNRKNEASRILQEEKAKARGPNWQERKDEARRILDQIRKTGKPFVPEATAKPVVSAPVPKPTATATATAPIPTAKPVVSAPVAKPTATATATAPIPNKPAPTAKPVVSAPVPVSKPTATTTAPIPTAKPVVSTPVPKPTATATAPIPTAKPKPTAKPVVKPKNLEEFTNALSPKQLADFKEKIKTAKEIIVNARTSGSMKLKSVGFNFLGTKFNVTANKDLADKGTTKPTEVKPKYDLKGVKSLDELLSKLPPKHSEELRAKISRAEDKFVQTKNIKDLKFAYDFGDKRGPLDIQLEKDVIKFGSIASFPWKPKTRKEKRTEELRIATERNARKKAENMAKTAEAERARKIISSRESEKAAAKSENASSLSSIISGIDEENQQNKTYGIARDTKVFEGSDQYKELQKKLALAREERAQQSRRDLVGSTNYNVGDINKGLSPSVYNLGYQRRDVASLAKNQIEGKLSDLRESEFSEPKKEARTPFQERLFKRSQDRPIGVNDEYKAPQAQQQVDAPRFKFFSDIPGTSPQAQRLKMQREERDFNENLNIKIARSQKTKKEPRTPKTESERYNISRKQSAPAQEKTLFDEMELAKIGSYGTQEQKIKDDADKAKRFRDAASESARVKFKLNPRQQRRAVANENLAENLSGLRSTATAKPVVSETKPQAQATIPIAIAKPVVSEPKPQATTPTAKPIVSLPNTQIPEDNYDPYAKVKKPRKPRKPRATKNISNTASYDAQEAEYQRLLAGIAAASRTKKGRFATGGLVPGTGNSDTVPMDLPEGSFVIRKSSVNKIGADNLAKASRFARGGTVPALVMPGEYIYSPQEASKIGSSKLHAMNQFAKFARGGSVKLGKGGTPLSEDNTFDPTDPRKMARLAKQLVDQQQQNNPDLTRSQARTKAATSYNDIKTKGQKLVDTSAEANRLKAQLERSTKTLEDQQTVTENLSKGIKGLEAAQKKQEAFLRANPGDARAQKKLDSVNNQLADKRRELVSEKSRLVPLQKTVAADQAKYKTAEDEQSKAKVDLDQYKVNKSGEVTLNNKVVGEQSSRGPGSISDIVKQKTAQFEATFNRKATKEDKRNLKQEALGEYRTGVEKQVRADAVKRGKPVNDIQVQSVVDNYVNQASKGQRKLMTNAQGEITGDTGLGKKLVGGGYKETGELTGRGKAQDFAERALFGAKRTDFETGSEGDQQFKQSRGSTVANRLTTAAVGASFVSERIKSSGGTAAGIVSKGEGDTVKVDEGAASSFKSAQAFGAALSSASTYAAVAGQSLAKFGPLVAGVGAGFAGIVGALEGYHNGIKQAEAEIREAKIAQALNNLQNIFERVSSGLLEVNDSTLRKISENQKVVSQENATKAYEESGGNASNFMKGLNIVSFGLAGNDVNQKKYNESLSKSSKETNAAQIGPLTNVLNKYSEQIGKDAALKIKSGGGDISTTNFEDLKGGLLKDLRSSGGGAGAEQIAQIASAQDISIADAEKQFIKTLQESFQAEKIKSVTTKAVQENARAINSMQSLSNAVNAAAASADSFSSKLDTNSSLFEGSIGSTKLTSFAEKSGGSTPDFAKFNTAITESSGALGVYGEQFKSQGNAVNAASQILPDILAQSVANPISGKDTSTQITDALKEGLKARGITGSAADQVVSSVGGKVSSEDFTKLLAEAGGDVSKATQKLMSDISDPLISAFNEIDSKLTDAGNKYISGLEDLAKRQKAIGDQIGKLSELRSKSRSFAANEIQRLPGVQQGTAESINLQGARNDFSEQQQRLTGFGAGAAENPAAIASRLKNTQQQIRVQEEKVLNTNKSTNGGAEFRNAALELTKLKSQASNLNDALKNLTDQSKKLEAAQAKLAQVRQNIDEKRSLGRKLLTQGPEEQQKMLQGQAIFNQVQASGGSLQGMSTEQNAILFDFLDNFGAAGKKIQDQILDANGYGAGKDDKAEEKALVAEQARIFAQQEEAQRQIIANQQSLQQDYFSNLDSRNEKFYSELQKFTQEMQKNSLSAEKGKEQQKVAQIKDVQKEGKFLGESGFNTKEDFQKLSTYKGQVTSLAKNKQEQNRLAEAGSKDVTTDIKTYGNVITNTSDIEGALVKQGGYKGSEATKIREIAQEKINQGYGNNSLKLAREQFNQQKSDELNTEQTKIQGDFKGSGIEEKLNSLAQKLAGNEISFDQFDRALASVKELQLGVGEGLSTAAIGAEARIKALNEAINGLGGIQQLPSAEVKPQVSAFAVGGSVFKPRGTDTVPAMLTPGEFVVNRSATQQNLPLLQSINSGKTSYLAGGGIAGYINNTINNASSNLEFMNSDEYKNAIKQKYLQVASFSGELKTKADKLNKEKRNDDYLKESNVVFGSSRNWPSTINKAITKSDEKQNIIKLYNENFTTLANQTVESGKLGKELDNYDLGISKESKLNLFNSQAEIDKKSRDRGLDYFSSEYRTLKDEISSGQGAAVVQNSLLSTLSLGMSNLIPSKAEFDQYFPETNLGKKQIKVNESSKGYVDFALGIKQKGQMDYTQEINNAKKQFDKRIAEEKQKIADEQQRLKNEKEAQFKKDTAAKLDTSNVLDKQGVIAKTKDIEKQKAKLKGSGIQGDYVNSGLISEVGAQNVDKFIKEKGAKEDNYFFRRKGSPEAIAKIYLQREAQAQAIIGKMKLIQDNPEEDPTAIMPKFAFQVGQQELQKLINGEETTIDKKSLSNISAGQKKIVDSFITMNSFESAATSKGPEMASYIETYGKAITKDPQVLVEKLIKAKAKRSDISGDPEFIAAQAQGIFEALMFLDREGKANKLFASTNQIKKGRGFLEVLEEKSEKNIKSFTRFGKLTNNGIAENGIGNVNFGKKEDTEVDFSATNFRTAVPQMDNEQIIEVLMAKGLYPYKSGLDNNLLKNLDATASISNYGYLNFPANKEDVVQGLMDGGLFKVNSFPKQDDEGKTIFERQATIALLENKNTYQRLVEISKQIKGDGQEPNKKAESDPNSKSQTNVAKSSNGPLPSDDPNSIANRTRRGEINPQQGGVQLVNQIDDRNQADEIAALEQGDNEGRIRIMQKYQRMRDARATGMSVGGVVNYLATGGNVPSYRANPDPSFFKPKGTDTVPAMLSPGEFVINASATAKHGDLLSAINSGQDVGYSATGGLIEYLAYGDSATSLKKRLKNAGITQKGMMEAMQSGDKQQIYEMNLKAGDAQRNSRNEIISKQFERQAQKYFNLFNEQGPDANKKAGESRIGDLGNYAEGPQELGSYAIETKPIQLAKEQEQKQEQQQQKQTRTMPLLPPTQPTTTPPDVKDKKPDTTGAATTTQTQSVGEIEQLKAKMEALQAQQDAMANEELYFSKGGIPSSSSDTIPAMLTPGEFVVNARQSSKNASLLHAINSGEDIQGFANGGPVGYYSGGKTNGPSARFNAAASKFDGAISRFDAAVSRMSIPSGGSNNTAQYIDIAKSSFEELSRILKTEIKIGSGPIDKFNNAVTQFGTNSTGFNSGFSSSLEKFKTYVDELNAAINRIPGTLNLEIMGTLNASLNVNFDTNSVYAAVTDATESLKGWITSEIDRQITDEMG